MIQTQSTIFIQVAAYRDPDLPATLHNLLANATHPERLRIGICLQLKDTDPEEWRSEAFPSHRRLRSIQFDASESHGACWARAQAQTLFDGEDFLLQIDSHMRAVKNWDVKLIQAWIDSKDEKAILSVYPNGFQQPCELNTATLPVMAADHFDTYGILKFRGISRYRLPEQQPQKPLQNAFIAGGFLFGPGSIVEKVPYDPELYFYGEEISMSARLWTSGYNIYCPHKLLLFHLYKNGELTGDQSPTHWSDHNEWFQLNRRAIIRVHTLLDSLARAPKALRPTIEDVDSLNKYWLGEERSLKDFQTWSGVNFTNQKIMKHAMAGEFSQEQKMLSR